MRTVSKALVALALLACAHTEAANDPSCVHVEDGYGPAGTTPIRVERVASGLQVPWGLAFLPGGDVLVTERPGRLRLIRGGRLEAEPIATVPVRAEGEGGLLGIALDPKFAENRRFFLAYTLDRDGHTINRIARWVLSPDARSATEEKVLLDGIEGASVHDGGRLRTGPDGMLYASTGDARDPSRAQDRAGRNGKLLRLTPDGEVPADNPFPRSPVFLLGVRNSEGFDWLDPSTLVVADHGPSGEFSRSGNDEVTLARAGANLGWPTIYGCQAGTGFTSPLLTWKKAAPPGGLAVYRGNAIPAWKNSVLMGTLGSRHLHRLVLEGGALRSHEVYLHGDPPAGLGRIREVVQGPDGALWVTTSNCDGRGTCPPDKDVVARIVGR